MFAIFANSFPFSEAPPIRAPSMWTSLNKSSAFLLETLPPYITFGVKLFLDAAASKNNFTPKVIYGGSVSSKNAEDLFKEVHIDGALIGGASLNGKEFANIANIYINRGH